MIIKSDTEHCKIPALVVSLLGAIAIIVCVGILILIALGHTPDAALYTIPTGAVGALGAILSSTRGQAKGTPNDPVTVETAPEKPIETTPANDTPTNVSAAAVVEPPQEEFN